MTDDDRTLKERIEEEMVIDELPDDQLLRAIEGAVEIGKQSGRIYRTDALMDRQPTDRLLTVLLAGVARRRLLDHPTTVDHQRALRTASVDRDVATGCVWIGETDQGYRIPARNWPKAAQLLIDRYGGSDAE